MRSIKNGKSHTDVTAYREEIQEADTAEHQSTHEEAGKKLTVATAAKAKLNADILQVVKPPYPFQGVRRQ